MENFIFCEVFLRKGKKKYYRIVEKHEFQEAFAKLGDT